ncbi:PLC-like phosphodiesterase [Pyronema omphalodes]|nr:PLC-like phosphodiesterase [Pyronema omphalodes]
MLKPTFQLRSAAIFLSLSLFSATTSGWAFPDPQEVSPTTTTSFGGAAISGASGSGFDSSSFPVSTGTSSTISEVLLKGTNDLDPPKPTNARNETITGTGTDVPTQTDNAPAPTNTQPCNQYVEFCNRSWGNITYVAAHNSPFVRPNNAASNQRLDVIQQLNDGIRMLQGQTHKVNNTLYYCHTTCDLLNAGTVEDYLKKVVDWMYKNPYEIITFLIGNGDYLKAEEFRAPLENSGLSKLAYIPDNRTIAYNQWPTLSELILKGKRAIVFMDYEADENKIPYLLDEFTYMWETPFSQTDQNFPCTIDRPPDKKDWERKLYMANHNLNVEFQVYGTPALIPNTIEINRTNGVEGFGSLGLQANNCHTMWGRYPNFLLVDFYDSGNGSVFEVAAKANNVTYPGGCCGKVKSLATAAFVDPTWLLAEFLVFLTFFVLG